MKLMARIDNADLCMVIPFVDEKKSNKRLTGGEHNNRYCVCKEDHTSPPSNSRNYKRVDVAIPQKRDGILLAYNPIPHK